MDTIVGQMTDIQLSTYHQQSSSYSTNHKSASSDNQSPGQSQGHSDVLVVNGDTHKEVKSEQLLDSSGKPTKGEVISTSLTAGDASASIKRPVQKSISLPAAANVVATGNGIDGATTKGTVTQKSLTGSLIVLCLTK